MQMSNKLDEYPGRTKIQPTDTLQVRLNWQTSNMAVADQGVGLSQTEHQFIVLRNGEARTIHYGCDELREKNLLQ